MADDLKSFLRAAGAAEVDIERACEQGWLPLLAIDRVLMPGAPRFDLAEAAARAGTDFESARRLWRSLGFPDMPEGFPAFTDHDVEILAEATSRVWTADGFERLERQIRTIATSLARIASVEADMVVALVERLREELDDDEQVAMLLIEQLDWSAVERLVSYVHRLQLRSAVWREMALALVGDTVELAVGFVDLVGYTALSEELDEGDLESLLSSFELVTHDTVAEQGGRVVKNIGDEVMFAGVAKTVAVSALEIVRRVADDSNLPDVRAGVACGALLARDGDYYGPVVNLASRLSERARPGKVLASEGLRDALHDDPDLAWRSLGRRRIRGLGEVELYSMRYAHHDQPS